MIGSTFGQLTVVSEVWLTDSYGRRRSGAECVCSCGNTSTKLQSKLRAGEVKSCGCLRGANRRVSTVVTNPNGRAPTHGMTGSSTHSSWTNMKQRCSNPKAVNYLYYGGRGIKVCDRWHDFRNFLADMGERPVGMTLDRYPDKDGNYEPGNCRWATQQEQDENRAVVYQPRKIYGIA